MIRHVAVFRWRDGVTPVQVTALGEALATLPARIPAIRSYTFGPNAQPADGRWDYAVVADFDDLDGWRAYDEDEEHGRIRAELVMPLAAERTNLQLDLGSAAGST